MTTELIRSVIQNDAITQRTFCGVYPKDGMPRQIHTYPCGIIVNTDDHTKPGTHWLLIFIESPDYGEFIDSYGNPPSYYSDRFIKYLNKHCKEWTYNHKSLQDTFSTVCGEYTIFFLMHRARKISMKKIVSLFSRNKKRNDDIVYSFVSNYFNQ